MRIAILDPAAGISGDMTLGALLSLGLPVSWLEELPARLGVGDVGVTVRDVRRSGITCKQIDFAIPEQPHGRHVGELVKLVQRAPVSDWVKERAVRTFQLIGEAEGKVHGVLPDKVHLHEVGAIDAVLDIVGAIEGFERLGVDMIYNLPVAVGHGWVEAAHGKLPVPAPATAVLLEGLEIAAAGPVEGEATTPTGAALLRVLSAGSPPDQWRMSASGWGAGQRDPRHYPNALRILVAEVADERARVVLLATDVDDMSPEYVEPLRQALIAAGALDVQTWPVQMKKARQGFRVEVMAPEALADAVTEALFRHSTTAGVRRWTAERSTLPRHQMTVRVDGVPVRVKVLEQDGVRVKPEYEDVLEAAKALGRPPLEVARVVTRDAEAIVAKSKE
jgi:pyridinium-3,5-bisthiocarboxylic acid mononucleotide nickel chelatase